MGIEGEWPRGTGINTALLSRWAHIISFDIAAYIAIAYAFFSAWGMGVASRICASLHDN